MAKLTTEPEGDGNSDEVVLEKGMEVTDVGVEDLSPAERQAFEALKAGETQTREKVFNAAQ